MQKILPKDIFHKGLHESLSGSGTSKIWVFFNKTSRDCYERKTKMPPGFFSI